MGANRRFGPVLVVATLLLGSALTLTLDPVAGLENRKARDQGNLRELWHVGLGTTIGELGAMGLGDIDNDGKQELVFGNGQGYVHILEFSPGRGANGGFVEQWQSVKLGGPIRGVAMANVDDDPALEIAIAVSDVSRAAVVYLFDGATMADEENWTAGLTFAVGSSQNEVVSKPYGLVFEDVDNDGQVELIMGGDQGNLWVLDALAPEGEYPNYNVEKQYGEGEWVHSLGDDTESSEENAFGVAVGKFDNDANFEIMGTTKDGDLLVYDGVTHDLEFQATVGPNPYGGLGADLNGDGKDEFIVGDDNNLQLYKGGSTHTRVVAMPQIREARGLLAVDLYGDSNLELVAVTNRGDIYVLSYDGTSLEVDQSWASGESFRADGGGLAFLPGEGWLLHGGDQGVVRAWEVPSAASHSPMWSTYPTEVPEGGPYSIVGGYAYGNAIGDIDGDGVNELVIGSHEGRVMAFDGATKVLDWYSDLLEGPVVGLEITDVTGDGEPDLLVGTGDPFFTDGEGSEVVGKLHVFYNWNSGSGDFTDHYETSGDIESVWGIAVGELDGSNYPEIALAVAQSRDTGNPNDPVAYEGWLKIYGFSGSTFQEEYSTGDEDYNSLALGVAIGDADNDGSNEVVVGVANNSQGMKGRLYLYDYSGGSYVRSLNYATDNPSPYGLQVVNVDNSTDGSIEIVTGDAENPGADTNGRLTVYYYDGNAMARKTYKDLGTSAAWGLWAGNLDGDYQNESVVGTASGKLMIYPTYSACDNVQTHASSLSANAGFYGGINAGNLTGDDRQELVVGSESYVWVFEVEGRFDRPDLEVCNGEIYFAPAESLGDEDATIGVRVRNVGDKSIDQWRIGIYEGLALPRYKLAEYPAAGQEAGTLSSGAELNVSLTWKAPLGSGLHRLLVVVKETQTPPRETNLLNNEAWATYYVKPLPNVSPVPQLRTNLTSLAQIYDGEFITLDASGSYDPDNRSALLYRFSTDDIEGESAWVSDWGREGDYLTFSRNGMPLTDKRGITRQFQIINGTISINYTLEPTESSHIFYPQVMVKEIPAPPSSEYPLQSWWTSPGTVTITVTRPPNRPPSAVAMAMIADNASALTPDPLEVKVGQTLVFIADNATDPDGDILTFTWTIEGFYYAGRASDGEKAYTFTEAGTYVVTLTVSDGRGAVATDTITIIVTEPSPDGPTETQPFVSLSFAILVVVVALAIRRRQRPKIATPIALNPN